MQSSADNPSPTSDRDAASPNTHSQWLRPTWFWGLIPALAAITYPYALKITHASVVHADSAPFTGGLLGVAAFVWALIVPILGIYFARRLPGNTQMRRLAYATVIVPALYVFLGEIQRIFNSPVSDELIWWALWVIVGAMAVSASQDKVRTSSRQDVQRWRSVHGVTASAITVFVVFHLLNQLAGLFGAEVYAEVQRIGSIVYRAPVVEAILVGLMISQVISGARVAWRWGPLKADTHRVMQVAAGNYLALFILAHMLSIFLYTRTMLHQPTDWHYAIAAPQGYLHDVWNIRLIPYYGFGVFFVLSHIASGVRWMMMQRGANQSRVHRSWLAANVLSALVSVAILIGLIFPSL